MIESYLFIYLQSTFTNTYLLKNLFSMYKNLFFYIVFVQSLLLFGQSNDTKQITITEIDRLNKQSLKLFDEGEVNKALLSYKETIEKAKEINYLYGLSNAYLEAANCFYELSLPNEGSQYLFFAEQYAHDNSELMTKIYFLKGLILLQAHSYDEAEKKFRNTIEYAEKVKDKKMSKKYIDRSNINIANINFLLEKYDSALSNYNKVFSSLDILHKVGTSINIAEIYLLTNKIDSAQKYLKIAEKDIHLITEKRMYNNINGGLKGVKGLYYIKIGEYQNALNVLKGNSITTTFYNSDELLGMAYAKLHKTDSSLYYFERNLKNKLDNRLHNEKVYNASSLIYNEEKIALQKNYEQKRRTYLLLIGLTCLIIFLLLFIIYNRKKLSKQRTQFLESEKERLQMEKELSDLKQEHYQKQVLATSIQLEQKNKFLDELKENIKNNKEFNINSYLKNEQLIDKDLNNIHDIVKEVHPNFFKNLSDIAENKLTNLDIKYAAYIYMHMDNTQIAAIQNVDPKTVSVTKYRLKQKIGLLKDVDLDTFIRNLG